MHRFRFALAALAILLAPAARATTVVMASDETLLDSADTVLRAEILSAKPGRTPSGLPATEYRARVATVLKGDAPSEITLRVLGGTTADGHVWQVWGVPHFTTGETALLFLMKHPDGTWGPLHLAMGAFHEVQTASRRLAVRDLTEMEDASGKDLVADPARDATRFRQWIEDRVAGRPGSSDYRVALAPAELGRIRPTFTYIGGSKRRWTAFDAGATVHWRANESGQDGAPGNGFDELKSAINAWNSDPDTNIRYQYDGTTSNSNGFTPENGDDQNVVLWNDPNSEVEGTFSCRFPGNGSGVLAIGGPYSTSGGQIVEADVITNDGVGCWINGDGSRLSQVLGHELGHTLGLGHSCGDDRSPDCGTSALLNDALMRANAHNDKRGPRLNDDDRAGIFSLYPAPGSGGGGGGGGNKPAAPTGLATSDLTTTSVHLTWVDNANNETSYRLEVKVGSGSFVEKNSFDANTVTAVVGSLTPATAYSFRVRARNNSGPSNYSNVVNLTTPSAVPAAPAKLVAAALSTTQVQLTWQDKSSNETGFGIEVESPSSPGFQSLGVAAANLTTFTANGLAAGTPYTFRIRALGAGGSSAFAPEASATTAGAGGPCVASADALCLSGERFRVKAAWRKATGEHGVGTAVPYANGDQSGLFWFFDASNIELLVKVLDGTSSNQHYWVFYGALTDVQYWITVEDTVLGHSATYHNPQGSFCGAADTSALAATTASAGRFVELAPSTAGNFVAESIGGALAPACVPNATTLCLLGGRFKVEVSFTSNGGSGDGQALPLPGDASGMFWFFDIANVELAVKAIDGSGLNGKYWIFYGALTDVAYDLEVTDTTTSVSKTYHNAQGSLCGKGDTTAFTP